MNKKTYTAPACETLDLGIKNQMLLTISGNTEDANNIQFGGSAHEAGVDAADANTNGWELW